MCYEGKTIIKQKIYSFDIHVYSKINAILNYETLVAYTKMSNDYDLGMFHCKATMLQNWSLHPVYNNVNNSTSFAKLCVSSYFKATNSPL